MKLIDNINNRLGEDLKLSIRKGSKLSIAASSFSIYAYEVIIPVKVGQYSGAK